MFNLESPITDKQLVPIVGLTCGFIFTITGYLGITRIDSKILDNDNSYIRNSYYIACVSMVGCGVYMVWYFNEYRQQV